MRTKERDVHNKNQKGLERVVEQIMEKSERESGMRNKNGAARQTKILRITWQIIEKLKRQKSKKQNYGLSGRDGREALIILEKLLSSPEAKNAHFECISAYKEVASGNSISDSLETKVEYLSCLKHLSSLLDAGRGQKYRGTTLQELKDEMKGVELDMNNMILFTLQ